MAFVSAVSARAASSARGRQPDPPATAISRRRSSRVATLAIASALVSPTSDATNATPARRTPSVSIGRRQPPPRHHLADFALPSALG